MAVKPIFDAFNRPARYSGVSAYRRPLDQSGASARTRNDPRMDQDHWRLVPTQTHKDMLSDSRNIARHPVVRGMVVQKADYVGAAGWMPTYAGESETVGEIYEAWLEQFFKICNVRGELLDFATMMNAGCEALDVDNDFFVLLTETATQYPQFQCFEAHRIHSRGGQTKVTKETSPYFGFPIVAGIVYGSYGEEVAYQVLGDTEAEDEIVPAADMVRCADLHRYSEGRGLSPVSYALHEWYNYRDCQDNELKAQRITSSISILESNEDGAAPDVGEELLGSEAASTDVSVRELEGGMYRYIKSGSGSLEAFLSNRPSSEVAAFWRAVCADAAYGMEWRREMMDLAALGGAGIRGFADNINTVIHARHKVLVRCAQRLVRWAIAKAIKRGDLPEDKDWWMWDFPQPPDFTVDAGRTVSADVDAVRAGFDCEENIIASRLGTTMRRMLLKKARGYKMKKEIAAKYDLRPEELGYLTRPGDVQQPPANAESISDAADGNADDSNDGNDSTQ